MNLRILSIRILKLPPAAFLVALLILSAGNSGIAQTAGNWSLVNSPNPSSNASRLSGTVAIAANDVWAVGHHVSGGSFENLAMHWNGSQWTVVPTPRVDVSPTNQLKKVIALSSNDVWAVGGHEYAYTLHWNGSVWSVVNIGAVPGGNTPTLSDISAVSPNDIWAVGNYASNFGRVSTVIMHWNGNAWTRVPSPDAEVVPGSPRSSFLHSVEAISANNVWAVGEYLVGNKSFPLVEHWDGTSWTIVPSPSHPTTGDGRLFGISVNSATDIWAVGEHDITNFNNFGKSFAMHWNGSQWTVVPTPHPGAQNATSRLSAVEALSADNVWAVGTATNSTQGLSTFVVHWNGSAWSRVATPNVPPENSTGWNQLQDISAVSPRNIWAVGYGQSTFGVPDVTITENYTESVTNRTKFDFDGDNKADISVYRPSEGNWYLLQSTQGFSVTHWGISSDKIMPADYDGDGKTDFAIFRRGENSTWYILRSATNTISTAQWGATNLEQAILFDTPVPSDYDGDGKADLAVWRLTDNLGEPARFLVLQSSDNSARVQQWGNSSDRPVPADYDGDGRADFAIYRGGTWYILQSTDNSWRVTQFGLSQDKTVPADYDGDGKTDLAVYRGGIWYLLQSTNGFTALQFGLADDVPTAADYDGDGKADVAVFRNGVWYLLQSANGVLITQFGLADDIPITSAFVR